MEARQDNILKTWYRYIEIFDISAGDTIRYDISISNWYFRCIEAALVLTGSYKSCCQLGISKLIHCCVKLLFVTSPPLIGGALSDVLADVWRMSVWRLSVSRVHQVSTLPHRASRCLSITNIQGARRAGRRRHKACMGWSWAAACGVQGRGILRGFPHSLLKWECELKIKCSKIFRYSRV